MTTDRSPVYGMMKHPSLVDFPGCLATVLFTAGCNFRCGYCHNPEALRAGGPRWTWNRLHDLLRQKTADWVDGAVVTGGEPCIAPGTPQLVRLLKEQGWRVKLDTNGSRPDRLAALLPEVDYVAMDVKCAPETYPELTGFDDTDRIRESIDLLRESACAYEFRTTVLPDLHTDRELVAVGAAVRGAQRLALQAFVPRDHLPDPRYRRLPRTPPERLREAADLLRPFVRDIELRGVEAGHRAA